GARLLHVIADGYFWDYVHLCTDPSKVDWRITVAECGSERYQGVWDAAKGVCHPTEADCFAWAKFWAGGLTYYGGFIGASAAAWYLLKRDRFPFWKAADMAGMVIPIGLGFGRMGCLLAGCCFGTPTSVGWALSFPSHSPASESQFKAGLLQSSFEPSLGVHPTQIYESAGSFVIAAVLILWLAGRKRLDVDVAVALGCDALEGLEAIHANGLVHGDVKPFTIHVEEVHGAPRAMLVDGGITKGLWTAKHLGEKTALIGTPVYAPVEQFGGDSPNAQSDIYNVATVLFELIAGAVPWPGSSFLEVFQAKLAPAVPTIRQRAPDIKVPTAVEEAILDGLRSDARERWATAREFRSALQAALED
ncbi:MAG TPA: prolipoprotein diacylglyceryl transferase, partial [Polyangiaceae bacterium]|nr:prolipoprotein diacylglyceryl transferase [Polyangiaceae bacterium]